MGGVRALELSTTVKEYKDRLTEMKISRGKAIVAAFVLIGVLLTIGLAGSVPAQNIQVINGKQYLGSIYAEPTTPKIGYRDSSSPGWTLTGSSSNSSAQLSSPNIINFTGAFQPSKTGSSLQISKKFSVDLNSYPILYVQVQVTAGVGYGFRFFSSVSGNSIPFWNNSDVLNHRTGTGQIENIQVNLQQLSVANTGKYAPNISLMQVYVERRALNATTNFSLLIQNLKFLDYQITSYEEGHAYHSIYLTFAHLPTAGNTSWILNKIDLGMQISATAGTTYQLYQLNGSKALSGTSYTYSSAISSYDYSIYPKGNQIVFPESLPPSSGYSIVVVAQKGALSNLTVNSVNFVFTPSANFTSQPVTAATVSAVGTWWYGYLIFFLFAAPVGVAFLLYNRYKKDEEFKPWQIGIALGTGIICRLALAPIAGQPFDIGVYATSARGWFEFGTPGTSLGPTLPVTFFLYWVPYSFYALLLKLGFHDFFILGHQTGFVETIFLKGFPIISDLFVCYLIYKFNPGNVGKLFAFFYLLNPLSIYVSSVWGQYEASTVGFMVLGFLFLMKREEDEENGLGYDLKASLAFVGSALIELVGLIPLAFLVIKSALTKPFKPLRILLLCSPVLLLFVIPSEAHLIYLIAAAAIGASSVLLLSQPHTPYTILSNFPALNAFHPLVLLLGVVAAVFIFRRKFDLQSLVSYTLISFVIFLIFSAQQPQWWVFILPLGFVYALVSEKYSLGTYMLAFGTMTAFLILSFTQGSGYMLFGSAKFNLLPSIENLKNGIDLFTVTTTIGALTILGYLLAGDRVLGPRPLLRGSMILSAVLAVSFIWFAVAGGTL